MWVGEYRTGSGSDRVELALIRTSVNEFQDGQFTTLTLNLTVRRPGRYGFRFCIRCPTIRQNCSTMAYLSHLTMKVYFWFKMARLAQARPPFTDAGILADSNNKTPVPA